MATLKQKLDLHIAHTRTLYDAALKTEDKAAIAQEGLIQSIVYQRMIDQLGEDASFEENEQRSAQITEEVKADQFLMDEIRRMEDPAFPFQMMEMPKDFLQDLAPRRRQHDIIQETMGALKRFADSKDFQGMSNYAVDTFLNANDPDFDAKLEGVSKYFGELLAPAVEKKGVDGKPDTMEPDPKSLEVFDRFYDQFLDRYAIACGERVDAQARIEGEIREGVYHDTELIQDDPKLTRKIADVMASSQTDPGLTVSACNAFNETLTQNLSLECFVGEDHIGEYCEKKRVGKITQKLEETHPDMIRKMREKGEDDFLEDLTGLFKPSDIVESVQGYVVKSGYVAPGASPFSKVPEANAKYLNMPVEELLRAEEAQRDHLAQKKADNAKLLENFGKEIDPLCEALKNDPPPEDHPNAIASYNKLLMEMENFKKVGRVGYKYVGDIDKAEGVLTKNENMTTNMAKSALGRLKDAAVKYVEYDEEFGKKLEGFDWQVREKYKAELSRKGTDVSLDFIERVKKVRKIEDQSLDADTEMVDRMAEIPDKLAAVSKKFSDGKLWLRGSSEYDAVGKAMDELKRRLNNMQKNDAEIFMMEGKEKEDALRAKKAETEAVQEQIRVLKEKTAAYYAHKAKDGQWRKGTNKNADQRIEAVQEVDAFASDLEMLFNKRARMTEQAIQTSIESRKPDYESWCARYPKGKAAYEEAGEPVPESVQKIEASLTTMRSANITLYNMKNPVWKAKGKPEAAFFADNYSKILSLLMTKDQLEARKTKAEDWDRTLNGTAKYLSEWLQQDDHFKTLMDESEEYSQRCDPPTKRQELLDGLRAVNELTKANIPVDALEAKYVAAKEAAAREAEEQRKREEARRKEEAQKYEARRKHEQRKQALPDDKEAFREQAIDLYARGVQEYRIAQHLKAHPEYTVEQVKEVRESNAYDLVRDAEQNKAYKAEFAKSKLFTDFMDSITTPDRLDAAKSLADKGGTTLYDFINDELFRPAGLDKMVKQAQHDLITARSAVMEALEKDPQAQNIPANDPKTYPDKEAHREDYAVIMASNYLRLASKADPKKTYNGLDLVGMTNVMREKESFQAMMELQSGKDLYHSATTRFGEDLALNYTRAKKQHMLNKQRKEDHQKKQQADHELEKKQPGAALGDNKKK